jgi:MFS family permease
MDPVPMNPVPMSRARRRTLAVLCMALVVIVIDNTILAVAFPSIATGLDADEAALQWIGSAYGLVLAGLLLPLAVVGDRHGRRRMLMIGLAVFGVASAAAAFAPTTTMLVLARGAMGVGGACAMPATLSTIGNVFPGQERGKAISVWAGVAGLATAAGPVIGGLLLARFWWGSVFLVNVPVVLVTLALTWRWVPESRDRESPRVDVRSALCWWGALTAAIVAVIEGPQQGWLSPIVLGAAALGALFLFGFGRSEARSSGPLIDEATRRDPRLRWGAATMSALFFTLMGMQFVLTQWIQGPLRESAMVAGLFFVPMAVSSLLTALANPRWVRAHGHGPVAACGLAGAALGAAIAALAVVAESLPGVAVAGVFVGFGVGAAAASGAELIMSSAPPERAGSASGVNETLVEAAGALGIAVLGSVLVETGSFAWPLPVAALAAAVVAVGVMRGLTPRPARDAGHR